MRLYLAGPLFTIAEREWNQRLSDAIAEEGHEVFLPQTNEPRELTADSIFQSDRDGLDWADAVVAILDGSDPDSGTCWEVGYAYAKKKPVVCVRTDFRGSGEGNLAPYNLMLYGSGSAFVTVNSITTSTEQLVAKIVESLGAIGN